MLIWTTPSITFLKNDSYHWAFPWIPTSFNFPGSYAHKQVCGDSLIVLFLVKTTDGRKLSHCGLKTGMLTQLTLLWPFSQKSYLFSLIIFLRQVNKQDKPESDLWSDWYKLCLVVNVWASLDHTCSVCAICFIQRYHRLLQTDSFILSFLYSSEWVLSCFCSFFHQRGGKAVNPLQRTVFCFFFVFLTLGFWLTSRRTVITIHRTSMHILLEQITAEKSTSLPFLCFAIEYISTVSHCHSLWQ